MDETKRSPGRPRRPGGKHEPHTYRFDPAMYARAEDIAARRGETVADVVIRALESYVRRHRGEIE